MLGLTENGNSAAIISLGEKCISGVEGNYRLTIAMGRYE